MDQSELPYSSENIANDFQKMGKENPKDMANKASYKLAEDFHAITSPEERREFFNDLAERTRKDADKNHRLYCKTTDNQVKEVLTDKDKDIKEIWIGDPARELFMNWDNYKVYSENKEKAKAEHNEASLSQRQGMLKTLLDENHL